MVYFDENHFLDHWTQSIIELSRLMTAQGSALQCVLVNNGEQSRPFEDVVLRLANASVPLRCFENSPKARSLGRARQLILDESRRVDFLCMMDPDCEWSATALLSLVELLKKDREVTACGPTIRSNLDSIFVPLNRFYRSPQTSHQRIGSTDSHQKTKKNQKLKPKSTFQLSVDHIPTTLIVLRVERSLLDFKATFTRTGEDLEWGLRMTKVHKFCVTSSVEVCHHLSDSWKVQFQRLFRFGYIQPYAAVSARRLTPRFIRAFVASFVCVSFALATLNIWMMPLLASSAVILLIREALVFKGKNLGRFRLGQGGLIKFIGIILLPIPYMCGVVLGCLEIVYRRKPRF